MTSNQEDKIISEFLESIGPWRDVVIIGGDFALFVYKLYLSDPKLENPPVGTRDVDSFIPRKIPEVSKKNIQNYLQEAGFNQVFKDLDNPAILQLENPKYQLKKTCIHFQLLLFPLQLTIFYHTLVF